MNRENRFVIRLTEAERRTIERLARLEKLAPSTFARRRLLFEAEQRGIVHVSQKHEISAQVVEAGRADFAGK